MVADILARRAIAGPISAEAELTQLGLTSLDMVELMLRIEAEFDITIPAEKITPASFGSVASIAAMLGDILAGSQRS
jgi:acyl carrier protein